MNFIEKLRNAAAANNSHVCVGLDSDFDKLPDSLKSTEKPQLEFNRRIIDATSQHVCVYKLNIAFYECRGAEGWNSLQRTIEYIPDNIPVIIDAKRADIGNTSKKYAEAIYDILKADAVTVNPYLGIDGIKPFLEYRDKCAIVLCHTSNPSAADFQQVPVINKTFLRTVGAQLELLKKLLKGDRLSDTNIPNELDYPSSPELLYELVARKIAEWNKTGSCGMVVGATVPEELSRVIALAPGIPLLIPGIGAQGGNIKEVVSRLKGVDFMINSSRGIIFASGYDDFAEAAERQTIALKDIINDILGNS
jgi:orotidine-5'-phosphate decarboxylase